MSLAVVHSRAQVGIAAPQVTVEVHMANGLPSMSIVGLPETEVKESKDRVRSAILNSQFEFPARRITINLAPADLPKEGGRFDLPIAIGILAASGQIGQEYLNDYEFVGELALTGQLRPIRGALAAALAARDRARGLFVPHENGAESALVSAAQIFCAAHLLEVAAHLSGTHALTARTAEALIPPATGGVDFSDIRGQPHAKRACEIAAAGAHNLLMIGPPGAGKTMLAQRIPGILPALDEAEALEVAAIYSITKGFDVRTWRQRAFRAPHHTASTVALVGGGGDPRPGEVSLAHCGVLFLDELPEFDRRVLEGLREPLESGIVHISRAARQAEFPARFQFIAAMNPCPCGYHGDAGGRCRCTPDQVRAYRARLSGPLLDRIDIFLEVPALPVADLIDQHADTGETSATIRARVIAARALQMQRAGVANRFLTNKQVEAHCRLDADSERLLARAITQLGLSARAYHRILKVARTIADLGDRRDIDATHIGEALQLRRWR